MAERAGYTVTMFLIDVSPSMGKTREVELPPGPDGEPRTIETSNLEWSLQFVKLKIQEMIYNGRKTDQCGVILFGTEETDNIINEKDGGYEHVSTYIPIGQPNADTLAKIAALEPSTEIGDPIDAIIVGVETQDRYLANKKTWTRKMVLITDGENPIEIEDWEATTRKMNTLSVSLTVVGVDFDDDDYPFHEEHKSNIKHANETFFHTFVSSLSNGIVGNCDYALEEISRPDIKNVKSALTGTELRLGDVDEYPDDAFKIMVKTSKCTALMRPKSWKKFSRRTKKDMQELMEVDEEDENEEKAVYAQLNMRTEYYLDKDKDKEDREQEQETQRQEPTIEDVDMDTESQGAKKKEPGMLEKELLVRGYKYGSSYVPCPDGSFPRLPTKKGIEFCGFFLEKTFKRELAIGEVQYIWADPSSPREQVILSSIVQAMYQKGYLAIARWVTKDGMDPKMGVLKPSVFDNVDCFLWVQMPFADDVRKYTFGSLDRLLSKKGEVITNHPYLPTEEQLEAMEHFVDAMDLTEAGEKDEDGNRHAWFDTRLSYNPAIHRTKQAQFHAAVVQDLNTYPLPPPHPELLKYMDTPRKVLKRARAAIEECKQTFKVKEVPKKVARTRKEGHVHARTEDDEMILLDKVQPRPERNTQAQTQPTQVKLQVSPRSQGKKGPLPIDENDSATESEPEEEELLLDGKVPALNNKPKPPQESPSTTPQMPTPSRSRSASPAPDPGRAPGRIIGTTYPLEDFKKNTANGDLISKSVEDFGWVIKEIVLMPFSSRRTNELVQCMQAFRKFALEYDEIDAWNEFLQELKHTCMNTDPGNKDFWVHVVRLGRNMSLISEPEAKKAHGKSNISESLAQEFLQSS